MSITYDNKVVVSVNEQNFKTSGSFPVQQGKVCTIRVVGGRIVNPGNTVNFYGRVTVHN